MQKRNTKSESLLISTLILGGGLFVSKLIGAMYRIPLAGVLGGAGLGIYQMVFPLYALLLTLSSSAIPVSLAKVISENLSAGRCGDAVAVYKIARKYIVAISALASVLLACFASEVATLQGEALGGLAYIAIAPSILLVGFVACLRGKFQGMNNMLPTALSQICEQVGKLVFSIALPIFFGSTLEEKVALAVFGVTLSECCGLIFLMMYSAISKRTHKNPNSLAALWLLGESEFKKTKQHGGGVFSSGRMKILSPLLKLALPMTISFSVFPIAGIIESGLIINFLNAAGESGVGQFGIYSGGVVTMTSLPLGICSALGTALIPSISADAGAGDFSRVRCKISATIKAGMAVALGISMLFLFFSHQIVGLLFSKLAGESGGLLEKMLKWSFLNVMLCCFTNVTSSILYALSQGGAPLKSQLWGLLLRFVLMAALLPSLGIYASLVGVFFGGVVSSVMNFKKINKVLKTPFSFRPLLSGGLCAVLLGLCLAEFSETFELSVAGIAFLGVLYLAFLFLLVFVGYFTSPELKSVLGGKD